MQIDDFITLMKKRRSIRRFRPGTPIPDEHVNKMLEAARWAMSGGNGQPWQFVVVRDQETKNRIAEASMATRNEQWIIEKTRLPEMMHPQHGRPPESASYRTAQLLIVVLTDRRRYQATALSPLYVPGPGEATGTYIQSGANACHTICLAAAALGYASQWSTMVRIWHEAIKEILDIPVILDVMVVIPIGYPDYEPKSVYRRELKEMVHYEKYDRTREESGEDIVKWVSRLRDMTKPDYRQAEE